VLPLKSAAGQDGLTLPRLKSLYYNKQTQRHFWSVLSCSKNALFCAYSTPMYACQLWSKYIQTSMKRLCAAYNNAYWIMRYIPRNVSVRPHQANHCVMTFDALLRNNLYQFFIIYDAYLHPTFCSIASNVLMLFTNLHFSSIIQRSCMMETNKCSSCWWIVLVFVSHQHYFCVVKNVCEMFAHRAVKVFSSSQCWSCANIDSAMPYCSEGYD